MGCGRVVETAYLPALARVEAFRLVAVADWDRHRSDHVVAQATAARLGTPLAYSDLGSLLEGCEVDALVLATPPGGRFEEVERATSSGAAVLVEKPPALDAEEAAILAALEPPPWIGFNRRFDPGVESLRRAVAGRRVDLDLTITYRRAAWGAYTVDVEAILDLGPHVIDLARWLTGRDVTEVTAQRLDRERADMQLELGDSRARCRVATDRVHRELFEARTPDGEIVGRHQVGGLSAAVRSRLGPGPPANTLAESFTAELTDFAAVAAGGSPARLATARDGWAVMAAVDSVRASRSTGQSQKLPSIPPR